MIKTNQIKIEVLCVAESTMANGRRLKSLPSRVNLLVYGATSTKEAAAFSGKQI